MSYQLAISDWYPLKKNEIEKRLTWTTILVLVFFFVFFTDCKRPLGYIFLFTTLKKKNLLPAVKPLCRLR